MKTSLKWFILLICVSAMSLQGFCKQPFTNSEQLKMESNRKLIDSLKIHQLIAYQYDYVGGKKNQVGVIAESKNYNSKGYLKSELSTIDHELSYIWARSCKKEIESEGGLSRYNLVMHEMYSLPSVVRHYTYVKDTLDEVIEAFQLEDDTIISAIKFKYSNYYGFKNITEDMFTTSKKWLACKASDLNMNTYISVGDCGPWTFQFTATYTYNKQNNLSAISGKLITIPYSKQFITNKIGQVEKIVGYYNNSYKIISKQTFKYDTQGNVTFTDIEDAPGHIYIKQKYDNQNNLIEYEQDQADKKIILPGYAEARFRHSFYKYDSNGLLKERIDVGKGLDTLRTIAYTYRYDNNNKDAIADIVNSSIKTWKVKGKYESTQEWNTRISDENTKKQADIFRKDAINYLGMQRYNTIPIKIEYNADIESFKLTFEELAPIYLHVPRNEAEEFEKTIDKYTIDPQFEEGTSGFLELKSCSVKSTELSKEYKSALPKFQ